MRGRYSGNLPTAPRERLEEPRPRAGGPRPLNAAPVHLLAGALAHATDRTTDGALAGKESRNLPPAGWVKLSQLTHSLPPRHWPQTARIPRINNHLTAEGGERMAAVTVGNLAEVVHSTTSADARRGEGFPPLPEPAHGPSEARKRGARGEIN